MSNDITDEEFEALRQQIEASDKNIEDLAVLPEDEVQSIREQRDELSEKAKRPYAMALSEVTGMDEDMLMEHEAESLREEYNRRLEAREESSEEAGEQDQSGEEEMSEVGRGLAAQLTDPEPQTTSETEDETSQLGEGENPDDDVAELSGDELKEARDIDSRIQNFDRESRRNPQWEGAAERARDEFEELTGVEYDEHDFDL